MSSNNNDDNNSNDDGDDDGESLERARADLEMLLAAYPDEVVQQQQSLSDDHHDFEEEEDNLHTLCFPLQYLLRLSSTAHIHLQTTHGYPIQSNVQIHGYRCSPEEKSRMEATVSAIRQMSKVCLEEGVEGGFRCVSIALETWKEEDAACPSEVKNDTFDRTLATTPQPTQDGYNSNTTTASSSFHWISGTSLVDRKSVFVAHVCRIHREVDVQPALQSLLESNPKLQKATHNMVTKKIVVVCMYMYILNTQTETSHISCLNGFLLLFYIYIVGLSHLGSRRQ
jgi:hypothetical protein